MTAYQCRTFADTVTDFLDGALDSQAAALFLLHAESCTGCARYLEQLRRTLDLLRRLR